MTVKNNSKKSIGGLNNCNVNTVGKKGFSIRTGGASQCEYLKVVVMKAI